MFYSPPNILKEMEEKNEIKTVGATNKMENKKVNWVE